VGDEAGREDVDLEAREIRVRGKGGRQRTVRISHEAARRVDRYLRVRARHELAYRPELWLGVGNRGPLDRGGIYQLVVRRGVECGVRLHPHRFRHHFIRLRGRAELEHLAESATCEHRPSAANIRSIGASRHGRPQDWRYRAMRSGSFPKGPEPARGRLAVLRAGLSAGSE
jgi:integrase